MVADITNFATQTGATIAGSLTATDAVFNSLKPEGLITYGLIDYTFSGSPDLSAVLQGHELNVTGFANANNNGSGMYIQAVNNTTKVITAKITERTNSGEDESGATAAVTVTTEGTEIKAFSVAKNAQAFVTGEKISAGQLNWVLSEFKDLIVESSILIVADIATLEAIDTTALANNQRRQVPLYGIYRFDSASAATADGEFIIDPDTGPGQWLLEVKDKRYNSFKKISAAGTWAAFSYITEVICTINADFTSVTNGITSITVGGSEVFSLTPGTKLNRTIALTGALSVVSSAVLTNISNTTYDSLTFTVGAELTGANKISLKPDGTKMYIFGGLIANETVCQYTLSTPFNVSTASYDSKSFDANAQFGAGSVGGMFFKPDGSKVYLLDQGGDVIYQYTLSTAWDISTTSYDSKSFDVTAQQTVPSDFYISSTGLKLWVIGQSSSAIHQYTLSTPWDISTASYDSKTFSVAGQMTTAETLFFDLANGKFFVGKTANVIYEYSLPNVNDISTAVYTGNSYSTASQSTNVLGAYFDFSQNKMYIFEPASKRAFQYSLQSTFVGNGFIEVSVGKGS